MASEQAFRSRRLAGRFFALGAGLSGGGVLLVLLAATLPIQAEPETKATAERVSLEPKPAARAEVEPLLARLAGMTLIRPAQVQAAVKNDGTAERLLKKLKLQGVVQVGSEMVAYIQVDDGGKVVRSVRKGQTILDFSIDGVEPGKVTLSLQGVVVVLGHG
ncbi:MAG: hypothetical protein ACM359_03070 [Bacillota bacterium]